MDDSQVASSCMGLSIEVTWGGPVTIGLLEQFINQAKAAGASSDTVLEEIPYDQDPQITLGLPLTPSDWANGATTRSSYASQADVEHPQHARPNRQRRRG